MFCSLECPKSFEIICMKQYFPHCITIYKIGYFWPKVNFGEAPIRCLDSLWLGDQFILKRCIKSLSGCRFSDAVEALEQGWKDSWFLSKFAAFFRPDPDFRRYWKGFLRWNGVQYFSTKFAANTWKLSNLGETSQMKLNLRSQVWEYFDKKHCLRHNGPMGWHHITEIT